MSGAQGAAGAGSTPYVRMSIFIRAAHPRAAGAHGSSLPCDDLLSGRYQGKEALTVDSACAVADLAVTRTVAMLEHGAKCSLPFVFTGDAFPSPLHAHRTLIYNLQSVIRTNPTLTRSVHSKRPVDILSRSNDGI